MTDQNKTAIPAPDANRETAALDQSDIPSAREALSRYGIPAAMAAIIIIAGLSTSTYLRSRKENARTEAVMMLNSVRSIADLEKVTMQYAGTPAGPIALLHLAKARYDASDFTQAEADYTAFSQRFPKHRFAVSAELGRIHAIEAQGRFEEALNACETFLTRHPQHFQTPQAILAKARCLEGLNQMDAARQVYEDFIVGYPQSEWIDVAEDMLKTIETRTALPTRLEPATALSTPAETPALSPVMLTLPTPTEPTEETEPETRTE